MFCAKCGMENGDETKFCRGCGVSLGGAVHTPAVKGKQPRSLAERSVILYSRAIRGALTTVGLLIVAGILRATPPLDGKLWLLPLTLAFVVFAGTVARFFQARGYKKLAAKERPAELGAGTTEFIPPARSFYDTDDLAATPFSVTERTTNLLHRMGDDMNEDDL